MSKQEHGQPPEQEMPDYEMFPRGIWHLLGAIMLMVFSMAAVLIVVNRIFFLADAEIPVEVEFGVLALMAVLLSTPTFLLSRGWARCQTFLFWLNAVYLFVLAVGIGLFLLQADYGHAVIGVFGFVFASAARLLYRSSAYQAGVEYYRLIWAHYRAGTNRTS